MGLRLRRTACLINPWVACACWVDVWINSYGQCHATTTQICTEQAILEPQLGASSRHEAAVRVCPLLCSPSLNFKADVAQPQPTHHHAHTFPVVNRTL